MLRDGCSIGTCFSPEHDKSAFMIIIHVIVIIIVLIINIHSKHNRHFVVPWLFNLVVLIVSCANIKCYVISPVFLSITDIAIRPVFITQYNSTVYL